MFHCEAVRKDGLIFLWGLKKNGAGCHIRACPGVCLQQGMRWSRQYQKIHIFTVSSYLPISPLSPENIDSLVFAGQSIIQQNCEQNHFTCYARDV